MRLCAFKSRRPLCDFTHSLCGQPVARRTQTIGFPFSHLFERYALVFPHAVGQSSLLRRLNNPIRLGTLQTAFLLNFLFSYDKTRCAAPDPAALEHRRFLHQTTLFICTQFYSRASIFFPRSGEAAVLALFVLFARLAPTCLRNQSVQRLSAWKQKRIKS